MPIEADAWLPLAFVDDSHFRPPLSAAGPSMEHRVLTSSFLSGHCGGVTVVIAAIADSFILRLCKVGHPRSCRGWGIGSQETDANALSQDACSRLADSRVGI